MSETLAWLLIGVFVCILVIASARLTFDFLLWRQEKNRKQPEDGKKA